MRQQLKFWGRKSKTKSTTILFEPMGKSVEIGRSQTVLQVALSNKIPIHHTCDGMGSCTTCRIFVLEGDAGPRTNLEQDRADERGFAEDERLACQVRAKPGLVIKVPY
jgi:2Fe-2S ferredoxin